MSRHISTFVENAAKAAFERKDQPSRHFQRILERLNLQTKPRRGIQIVEDQCREKKAETNSVLFGVISEYRFL
jgi:hypothetical protein